MVRRAQDLEISHRISRQVQERRVRRLPLSPAISLRCRREMPSSRCEAAFANDCPRMRNLLRKDHDLPGLCIKYLVTARDARGTFQNETMLVFVLVNVQGGAFAATPSALVYTVCV